MYPMRQDKLSILGIQELARTLLDKGTVWSFVEIGCFAGESAVLWHAFLPNAMIFCIDPWKAGYDPNDNASSHNMTLVEEAFDKRTMDCYRLTKLKGTSSDFADHPWLLSVDATYIDGEHTYKGVKADIEFWLPRCKLAICGHDYHPSWPGVIQAVDEAFGKPDLVFSDNSWLKWVKQ